jgi:hypothetical protein
MEKFISRIHYTDQESLKVTFSYLIFKVESINNKFGPLSSFVKRYKLYGETNGKLYVLSEMVEPHDSLSTIVNTKLVNLNFKKYDDFVFGNEQLTATVKGKRSALLDKDIPSLKDVKWVGSVITESGNFVWYRNMKNWETYAEWRKKTYPQRRFNEFQLLLKKYYENIAREQPLEPILIEFRYDNIIFGLKGHKDIFELKFEKLDEFRKQLGELWYLDN